MKKNNSDVYRATLGFSFIKLLFGILVVVACLILFIILLSIGNLVGEDVGAAFVLIWFIVSVILALIVNRLLGYILTSGQIACAADYIKTNTLPDSTFDYSVIRVRNLFGSSDFYRQILGRIKNSTGQIYDFIKISDRNNIGNKILFPGIMLNYINLCIIGGVFYDDDRNIYRSMQSSIVAFYAGRKKTLSKMTQVAFSIISITAIILLISFFLFFIPLHAIASTSPYAFYASAVFAVILTHSIKSAFIDSYYTITLFLPFINVKSALGNTIEISDTLARHSQAFKKICSLCKQYGKQNGLQQVRR